MTYDQAFKKVIGHEGGYVNDPDDPGGETKYGISKRAYPGENIKDLTLDRAKELYRRDYWDKTRSDEIPEEIRYAHFDMAVNAGTGAAAKNLQRAARVKVDGQIGPHTLHAATQVRIGDYLFWRAIHYMKIMNKNNRLVKYAGGWSNRIADIYNDQ